jgi:primosomal protein N' (replication factor Y)
VIVQTLAPDARSIALAAEHDADTFVATELEWRRALRYPPFSTLVRIVCSSEPGGAAAAAAAAVRARLDGGAAGQALGPAPLFRLRGRERSQVVVKASERAAAVAAIDAAVQAVARDRAARGVSFSVDVDPQ